MIGSYKKTKGVVFDPAPVSPHITKRPWEILERYLEDKAFVVKNVVEPILCETPKQLEEEVKKLGGLVLMPRGQVKPSKTNSSSGDYIRDAAVAAYVLTQTKGLCECCLKPSPFSKANGMPYLEIHHVKQLSMGGSDMISNAVAVCPNCHRELHYGCEAEALKESLYRKVCRLEIE